MNKAKQVAIECEAAANAYLLAKTYAAVMTERVDAAIAKAEGRQ